MGSADSTSRASSPAMRFGSISWPARCTSEAGCWSADESRIRWIACTAGGWSTGIGSPTQLIGTRTASTVGGCGATGAGLISRPIRSSSSRPSAMAGCACGLPRISTRLRPNEAPPDSRSLEGIARLVPLASVVRKLRSPLPAFAPVPVELAVIGG